MSGNSNATLHCKRIQHDGPTSSNNVGCNMLDQFEHLAVVRCCWMMLDKDVQLDLTTPSSDDVGPI